MFFIEIDVKPLASGSTRLSRGDRDKPRARSPSPLPRTDYGVEDKGVNITIPGHIHKTDELPIISGGHPAEAVRLDLACPIDLEDGVTESLCVQDIQLFVTKPAAPLKLLVRHPTLPETRPVRRLMSAQGPTC